MFLSFSLNFQSDAAEMDAVDDFLAAMVDLSFLEDYEDRARAEMFHIKKRWEARVSRSIFIDSCYSTQDTLKSL